MKKLLLIPFILVFAASLIRTSFSALEISNNGFFYDITASMGTLTVGTLDFTLESGEDFAYPSNFRDMAPGQAAGKEISITNNGSLPFLYSVSVDGVGPDNGFCEGLWLSVDLEGEKIYDGYLKDFVLEGPVEISDKKDTWFYTIRLMPDIKTLNETCSFRFKFSGWQDNFGIHEDDGFFDTEEIGAELSSWGLKINEVYYNVNPEKGESPKDQWIELYNSSDSDISLKDWVISDNSTSRVIHANKTIPSLGYAVISKDNDTWAKGKGYWELPADTVRIALGHNIGDGLDIEGDRVVLSDPRGIQIDAMSYGSDDYAYFPLTPGVALGHSLARKPAGFDTDKGSDFVDVLYPTPGLETVGVDMKADGNESFVGNFENSDNSSSYFELLNGGDHFNSDISDDDRIVNDSGKDSNKNSSNYKTKD